MSTGLSCLSEDVCQHKLLAARAVVTGWIAVLMLWTVVALRLAHIDEWLFVTGLADIRGFWRGGTAPFSHLLIGGLLNAAAGWLVGWSHQRHKVAMVSAFFLSFVLVADLPRLIDVGAEAVQTGSTSWRGLQICLLDFLFMSLPILIAGTCGVRNMPVTRPATIGADASRPRRCAAHNHPVDESFRCNPPTPHRASHGASVHESL